MKLKQRLDQKMQELYPALSRTQIQSYIMQGKVMVDGQVCTKPGTLVMSGEIIQFSYQPPAYVSRAGQKLAYALDYFKVDPQGMVALDAGLSTGGFTDCLLKRGALKVYGVDAGYGQVHETLRQNPQVIVMERTNLRYLATLPEQVDVVTLDLSFISLTKVLAAVKKLMKPHALLITLIKPQFEAERGEVGKGGIVQDPAVHAKVQEKVIRACIQEGFVCKGIIESPVTGTDGNKEFLGYFVRTD
jgi:23S rRNA (cytidine1920-2'-O)/16S rRNA (cytidine1409-2'-O)-methyltransferase